MKEEEDGVGTLATIVALTFFIIIFIAMGFAFVGGSPLGKLEDVPITIQMQKVNGEWIQDTYLIPENSTFIISEHRGSYMLRYCAENEKWWKKDERGLIRNGIIDYKRIK